ncbi:FAD/NAD(P)-binding domain-containing protein [Ramaria rubella]|nr:FAD/NAD(P)-binding domain-containing protein [Ramaria rubella]
MSKFRVAIVGGGIAGLCLGAALVKQENIKVDIFEASKEFGEVGAGLTLWGRVCEALYLMGLAEDCIRASIVVASSSGLSASPGFKLRGNQSPHTEYGLLPFKDAWSLHRTDLLQILLRRVPTKHAHLQKKFASYTEDANTGEVTLQFADGTSAVCDLLIGCDGVRSPVRAQIMMHEAASSGSKECLRYVEPRWTGTIANRILINSKHLSARHPGHPMLSGGQAYIGKTRHVVGYPISPTTLNIAVNTTNLAQVNARWPAGHKPRVFDREAFSREVVPQFAGWGPEVQDIFECVDSAIEWPVMDLEPLPFYIRGNVAVIGDAAHAAVPYVGAGAAFAIEDAYVLSRILGSPAATRATLPLALDVFQHIRRPYGNKLVINARLALREFQLDGPSGNDLPRVAWSLNKVFDEAARVGGSGPEADGDRAVSLLAERVRGH